MGTHNSSVLFNPGGCLTATTFQRYLDGTLRPVEKAKAEDHLRHCLICSEALEGYKRHRNNSYMKSDLEFLSVRIKKRFSPERSRKFGLPAFIMITLFVFLILLLVIYYLINYLLTIA